jgi:hypothetical protein
MIRRTALLVALVGLAACSGQGSIEYRGEQIRLSRFYFDYDDYKNDPDNIHPSEIARVQRLVRLAPAGQDFGPWEKVAKSALDITFPGYGSGSLKSDWRSLRALSIEVPQAAEDRVIVFRAEDGGWRRIDDFLTTGAPAEVVEVGGELVISDFRGRRLAVRPLRPRA